eukprot:COSAG05_NODE_3517_length_2014_cov_7.247515_2_plen_160_part_00
MRLNAHVELLCQYWIVVPRKVCPPLSPPNCKLPPSSPTPACTQRPVACFFRLAHHAHWIACVAARHRYTMLALSSSIRRRSSETAANCRYVDPYMTPIRFISHTVDCLADCPLLPGGANVGGIATRYRLGDRAGGGGAHFSPLHVLIASFMYGAFEDNR